MTKIRPETIIQVRGMDLTLSDGFNLPIIHHPAFAAIPGGLKSTPRFKKLDAPRLIFNSGGASDIFRLRCISVFCGVVTSKLSIDEGSPANNKVASYLQAVRCIIGKFCGSLFQAFSHPLSSKSIHYGPVQ